MAFYAYLTDVKDGCFFFWKKYSSVSVSKSQINTAIGAWLIFYWVAVLLLVTGILHHQGIILIPNPLYSIFCLISVLGLTLAYMLVISPRLSKNISRGLTEQEKSLKIATFLWFVAGGFLLFSGVILLNQLVFFHPR